MDGDVIAIALKSFGPAGGLAVLLLGGSVWANWKLIVRLNKQHDAVVSLEKAHAEELAACQLSCEKEKALFREQMEMRYKEAVSIFLVRDDQKRQDITTLFTRFENLMGVMTEALSKWTSAIQELRYTVRDGQNHRS